MYTLSKKKMEEKKKIRSEEDVPSNGCP